MRAVVYDRYGPPEVLRVEERPIPTPGPHQVVVEVRATGVNLSDWETLTGRPIYGRLGGLRRPARHVLGSDIAGVVHALGADVAGWSVGDAVLADNLSLKGGFAEYAVVPADQLAAKPDAVSFEQAAAIPQPGAIAGTGTAELRSGDRFLVNGGGGGSGSLTIQLAKLAGAHVTAVDNAGKQDFMRQLGADAVLDYDVVDFTRTGGRWDRVLDLVATRSARAVSRAVAPGGTYWCVGGGVPTLLRIMVGGALFGRRSDRRVGMLVVHEGPTRFGPVLDACAAGDLTVHVAETFTLDQVSEALACVGAGEVNGKAVVLPR